MAARDKLKERFQVKWLRHRGVNTELSGLLHRVLISTDDNNFAQTHCSLLPEHLDELQPIHPWHGQIQQDYLIPFLPLGKFFQGDESIMCGIYLVRFALQQVLQEGLYILIIINHQDALSHKLPFTFWHIGAVWPQIPACSPSLQV